VRIFYASLCVSAFISHHRGGRGALLGNMTVSWTMYLRSDEPGE